LKGKPSRMSLWNVCTLTRILFIRIHSERHGSTVVLDSAGRPGLTSISLKTGTVLASWGVTPDAVTLLGLVLHVPVILLLGQGWPLAAAAVLAAAGLMDFFDGAVAKARGGGTRRGAFFDSVADRVADAMLLGGVAWYASLESDVLVLLVIACLAATNLVSYVRNKAEAIGFDAHVGLMERAERLLFIGITLIIEQWVSVLSFALWLYLGLVVFTVLQRFVVVWRQGLTEPPLSPEEVRVLPDWRGLREVLVARDSSPKEVWVGQLDEWRVRRDAAGVRRKAARAASQALRDRVTSQRLERRAALQADPAVSSRGTIEGRAGFERFGRRRVRVRSETRRSGVGHRWRGRSDSSRRP